MAAIKVYRVLAQGRRRPIVLVVATTSWTRAAAAFHRINPTITEHYARNYGSVTRNVDDCRGAFKALGEPAWRIEGDTDWQEGPIP